MAEHPQEHEQEKPQSVAKLTAEIVVAYVTRNTVAPTDLGDLIGAVART
jgi:predicted transcriptional regulator